MCCEIPFGGSDKEEMIDYICKSCSYSEGVPDFVAEELNFDEKIEDYSVTCPKCGGKMKMKK